MKKIFISGSMSIKILPFNVKRALELLIEKKYKILVGDAPGIDELIQEFFLERGYFYVYVYSISSPRVFKTSRFKNIKVKFDENIKDKRERQTQKDIFMTNLSDMSFVIWNGKSKGSFNNALRSLKSGKKIQIHYKDYFLTENEKTLKNIMFIYEQNHMYSLSEYLKEEKDNIDIKTTKKMKETLIQKGVFIGENIDSQYKYDIDFKINRGKKIFVYRKSLLNTFFHNTTHPQNTLF